MSDEGREERMAARTRERRLAEAARHRAEDPATSDPFAPWRLPDDPVDVSPLVLAARCLGLTYGDPGPVLAPGVLLAAGSRSDASVSEPPKSS